MDNPHEKLHPAKIRDLNLAGKTDILLYKSMKTNLDYH